MSFKFTYDLDEFYPFPDLAVVVYGDVIPDVTSSSYGVDYSVHMITICGKETNMPPRVLSKDEPLYKIIEDALHTSDVSEHIEEKVKEYEANEYDAWMSDAYDRDRDDRMTGDL